MPSRSQPRSVGFAEVIVPGTGASLAKAVAEGRSTGRFNLQDRSLTEVPSLIWEQVPSGTADQCWWDAVDAKTVNIARNAISALPTELLQLANSLQTLDCSHNRLAALPPNLAALTALRSLLVARNCLTGLSEVVKLLSLRRLDCSGNALKDLPVDLGAAQPHLQILHVGSNSIEELPGSLAHADRQLALDASCNRLSSLQASMLSGLYGLTSLNLSQNLYKGQLLPEIGCLTRLEMLDLSQNRLSALPPTIGQCTALVELLLGSNQLTCIPDEAGQLSGLRTLDLCRNRLTSFPTAACELALSLLDLSDNNLAKLPPQLGRMTSLRALPLSGNPLRGVRTGQPLSSLLRSLRNSLEAPEDAPAQQPAAAVAVACTQAGSHNAALAGQQLERIPAVLWHEALASLDASGNCLAEWPLPAIALPALRSIDLSCNPGIASVPLNALTCCAASLEHLVISGVPAVAAVADSLVAGLPRLATLRLARCGLTSFPGLAHEHDATLRVLDVSSNLIPQIPESVSSLQMLEELNLANNNISMLPPKLGLLAKVCCLHLQGNPLRSIRRPVLEKGTQAVLEYLRGRIPAN